MPTNIKSNITLAEKAQRKILKGISQVSEVIRQSYGPFGGNVAIEHAEYPYHSIANDAQSIIQSIYLNDPVERRGLNFIKELSDKATKDSGEGRKTTIILAESILKEGFKQKVKGMRLKEELDNQLPFILEAIDKQSTKIETKDIGKVAATASRSKEIGDWIQKIYTEIGKEGIIDVEGSGMFDTFYETTLGVRFKDTQWLSPYMAHGEAYRALYKNPVIFITKKKIQNDGDIAGLLDAMLKTGKKDLVIFAGDIDSNVASRLVATHRAGVMNILVIIAPTLWKEYAFEDFSKCTGSTILDDTCGTTFKSLVDNINKKLFKLGTCDSLINDGTDTLLVGTSDIQDHIELLTRDGSNDSKIRLQWLNTKTAMLKLGAGGESELSYKLLKCKDALNACRAAFLDGVCEGGGKTLYNVGDELVVSPISQILIEALKEPYRQLCKNSGQEDVMNTENVLDATWVVKHAIKNAISLAGIVLTTQGDIRLREKSSKEIELEILSKKRMNI